ncbi:MAG: biopolymer transporter ExbD [Hydrocarboniphaga sp.]|uniref:ExbD/TolR family protein n=1 Tax=Hydrocarboniphaga sp. TaxID=2033016 RepID=UPI0026251AAE|nr:biopolymer transporter ExbD [Hydrocarboniphaga sp.]MDB5971872.1 biopolymer transporter ExbD [Hydrocarboniphaga sp.]
MMQGLAKGTRRAMRRARRRRGTELNLVSMIDVLTVLVFFLLVNQIGVSVLGIELPGPPVTSAEPPPPQQDLSVVVREAGLTLADNGQPLAEYPRGDRGYEYTALVAKLVELKQAAPDDQRISLLLEPGIAYETLVALMDAVRADSSVAGASGTELFPQVSVGVAPVAAPDAPAPATDTPAGVTP